MEPLGWATVAVAMLVSASYVIIIFLKQVRVVIHELKKLVRAARELLDEIRKTSTGESGGKRTKP
jgi:hypothetical protein